MRWWQKLRNDRKSWEQWNTELTWFRLRYEDVPGPRRAIELLSRPQTAGRVALLFRPGREISRLYVGVPERYALTLQRMAIDFAFSARLAESDVTQTATPMAAVDTFPWDRAFVAHVVDDCAFVSKPDAFGACLPQPTPDRQRGRWHLPEAAPAGLTLRPSRNGHLTSGSFVDNEGRRIWPLGRGPNGAMLYAPGPVNLYGRQEAVAAWLVQLVSHALANDRGGLIVIDGAGDLVPVLKRKSLVTRRLGRDLAYVDIDGAAVISGFNPLAPVYGETETKTLSRWQQWFAVMDTHPSGVQLLERAQEAGVDDILALQRWLQQPEQQQRPAAARSIQATLKRLLSESHTREWLSWPTNPFAGLPAGSLLFSCAGNDWSRWQLLQAVLLGALHIPDARLVLYGLPWKEIAPIELNAYEAMMLTNGPLLPLSTVVLAENHAQGAAVLARRFLQGNTLWQENLELLGRGEAIVVHGDEAIFAHWKTHLPGNRQLHQGK